MRIAFIGGWGHQKLRVCAKDPTIEGLEVAVATDAFDPMAARAVAEKIPGSQWFDNPWEMMDTFKPDVVNVGSVYGLNADFIAAALERHIPVVSDKPIATTWQQYERLAALAEKTKAPIVTEFEMRISPPFLAAHDAVRRGAIGRLVMATAQKSYRFGKRPSWYGRRADFGGLMLWVASHAIDYLWFCGGVSYRRVVGVQGNLSKPAYPEMEDHCMAMFELEGGAHAVVHADYLRPDGAPSHGDDRLRLVGTEGIIEVRDGRCELIDASGVQELKPTTAVRPSHIEMLDAALKGNSSWFGTQQSLTMARVLLSARDAADRREWVQI